MKIECTCGKWHEISATGLAIIIAAFQSGELTRVHGSQALVSLEPVCITTAFTDTERIASFHQRYKGNIISVDGERK